MKAFPLRMLLLKNSLFIIKNEFFMFIDSLIIKYLPTSSFTINILTVLYMYGFIGKIRQKTEFENTLFLAYKKLCK